MNGRQLVSIGALLGALCVLLWRARPARIDSAQVTSVAPGAPPLAQVALAYGRGTLPVSVIVDVLDEEGAALGSATVEGGRMLLEIPLARESGGYRVAVAAAHRLPWGIVVATGGA